MALTTQQCKAFKNNRDGKAQRICDGNGLYLVATGNSKSWIRRISIDGKRTDVGLGSFDNVSLADARNRSVRVKAQVLDGIDPRTGRRTKNAGVTFAECADAYMREHRGEWTPRTAKSWRANFDNHCQRIAKMPVAEIDTRDIKAVLLPHTQSKALLANLANRISAVLDWAIVENHRDLPNHTGVVAKSLPKCKAASKSHASIPHGEVRAALEAVDGTGVFESAKLATRFLTLTACRTSEVLGCRWSEIDLDAATWTIPAERMKMGKPHRVALSEQAVAVLRASKRRPGSDLVFHGRSGRLNDRAIRSALKRARVNSTGHGFRTSFSDWCRERGVNADVRESALAHQVAANTVQASYTQTDLLEQRRDVMQTWADHITGESE